MILKGIHLSKPKKTRKVYANTQWKQYSKSFLVMNSYCVVCGAEAKVVDHILPIEQGGSMWDARNHQALCKSCHGKKNNSDKEYYGMPKF